MSLIHGGKGIWWFGEPAGMLDQNGRNYYASLKSVTQELRLLRDVLHGSATELGRTMKLEMWVESSNRGLLTL